MKGKRTRHFKELLYDSFGNFVAQKLIEKAKYDGLTKVYDHFSRTFNDQRDALKKIKHGRQLIGKIDTVLSGGRKKGGTSSSSSVHSKVSN